MIIGKVYEPIYFIGGLLKGIVDFGGDLVNSVTGGILKEAGNAATRKADMKDWEHQQATLNQYQRDMTVFQNQQNLMYNSDLQDITNSKNREEHKYYFDNYNSPAAVMNSYKKAGINPNLVAGQISGTGSPSLSSAGSTSGSNGALSSASGNKTNTDSYLAREMREQLENSTNYQKEMVEHQKLINSRQKMENDAFEAGILVPEYDILTNPLPEGVTPSTKYVPKYRKATVPERFQAGLKRIVERSDREHHKNVNVVTAEIAAAAKNAIKDQFEEESWNALSKLGLRPIVLAALSAEQNYLEAKERVRKLKNDNDFSYKSVSDLLDKSTLNPDVKSIIKILLGILMD